VVFLLKIVNQMRYQEIRTITGSGIGKLKTDLHRARLEMRRMLAPYFARPISGKRGSL
jgi:RNA polymerase sigma-70 factor (ECF subfamily)